MLHFFYIGEGAFENKKLTAIDFAVIPLAKIEEEINKDEVKSEEEFTRKVEIPRVPPVWGEEQVKKKKKKKNRSMVSNFLTTIY
jgi:hypothetical protein